MKHAYVFAEKEISNFENFLPQETDLQLFFVFKGVDVF